MFGYVLSALITLFIITALLERRAQRLRVEAAEEERQREWERWHLVTGDLTNCDTQDIAIRRMAEEPSGAFPGRVLARFFGGDIVLCEEDQSYTGGRRTGNPQDYVLVSLHASDEEWETWESEHRVYWESLEAWFSENWGGEIQMEQQVEEMWTEFTEEIEKAEAEGRLTKVDFFKGL